MPTPTATDILLSEPGVADPAASVRDAISDIIRPPVASLPVAAQLRLAVVADLPEVTLADLLASPSLVVRARTTYHQWASMSDEQRDAATRAEHSVVRIAAVMAGGALGGISEARWWELAGDDCEWVRGYARICCPADEAGWWPSCEVSDAAGALRDILRRDWMLA
jgi:hypothetical protein